MNIGPFKAVRIGVKRAAVNWRIWFVVYGLNFVFAAFLALPLAETFAKDISKSVAGRDLLYGFNYRWYTGFVTSNGNVLQSFLPQAILIFLIYIIIEIFLAGGFYSMLCGNQKIGFWEFLARGSRYFFPLLSITVLECTTLFLLCLAIRGELSESVYQSIGVIAVFIIIVLSDFIRAAIVIDDDNFWSKVKRGLSFTALHSLSTFGVYFCCMIISAMVIGLFFLFHSVNDSTISAGIIVEILAGQIFVLLRIFSKLIFYAAEAALYKENQIEIINVNPEMLE